MAHLYNPKIQARFNRGVGEIVTAEKGEATGQSYKKGELVYIEAGEQTICGSDPTQIGGIALEDAAAVQATVAHLEPIYPGDEVEMYASTTLTTAMQGEPFGLVVSSNIWKIDLAESVNTRVRIKRLLKKANGDLDTDKCLVVFDADYLQSAGV